MTSSGAFDFVSKLPPKAPKWYCVLIGRTTGIFNTWTDCQKSIHNFAGAKLKSFLSLEEAEEYMRQNKGSLTRHWSDNQSVKRPLQFVADTAPQPDYSAMVAPPPPPKKTVPLHTEFVFTQRFKLKVDDDDAVLDMGNQNADMLPGNYDVRTVRGDRIRVVTTWNSSDRVLLWKDMKYWARLTTLRELHNGERRVSLLVSQCEPRQVYCNLVRDIPVSQMGSAADSLAVSIAEEKL